MPSALALSGNWKDLVLALAMDDGGRARWRTDDSNGAGEHRGGATRLRRMWRAKNGRDRRVVECTNGVWVYRWSISISALNF